MPCVGALSFAVRTGPSLYFYSSPSNNFRSHRKFCSRRVLYRGADKSLARPTSRCILFDGEKISFDASLVIYINIYDSHCCLRILIVRPCSYRCLYILNVVYVFLDAATLTEVFPCSFLGYKTNGRV